MVLKEQREYDEAKEKYLSLVRATRPFSRTSAQRQEIAWAEYKVDSTRTWLWLAKLREADRVYS